MCYVVVTWLVGGGKVQTTEQTQERKNVSEREREKEKEKEKDREREKERDWEREDKGETQKETETASNKCIANIATYLFCRWSGRKDPDRLLSCSSLCSAFL